jgi:uncharacterized protein YkwD
MIEDPELVTITSAYGPRRILRLAFLVVGMGMLVAASLFLLGGAWTQSPADNAAAYQAQAGTEQTYQSTPRSEALASQSPADLAARLLWISAALQPTPTSTPVPPPPPPASQAQQGASQASAPPASESSAPVAPSAPSGCPTASISGYAADLFYAINDARAQNGMGALAADGCVTYVAQVRSNDMASRGYFAHVSPDGSSAFSLLDAYGVPNGWAGENLARNNYPSDQTVAVAIRDLMASPPHRENILSPNYTAMGVAVAEDGTGILYYTMIFVGPA